jgi:hypothetical protein
LAIIQPHLLQMRLDGRPLPQDDSKSAHRPGIEFRPRVSSFL